MASFLAASFLLALFFINPSASEAATGTALIVSIDCGGTKAYTDGLGIPWTPDSVAIVKAGLPAAVRNNSVSQTMQTLRSFPFGNRNCYTLSIPSPRRQVLVRASFFYGNYDGKNSPPTFDLVLDGSLWAKVETAVDAVVSQEAIYVPSGGLASVCVVATAGGGTPFMSALEVRGLGDDMYSHYDRASSALVVAWRTAAGLPALVRYPDDPYDRFWQPLDSAEGLDLLSNHGEPMYASLKDAPPAAIFLYALTPNASSHDNAIRFTAPLPSSKVAAYLNLFFTEIADLGADDNRTFQIFVDGKVESDRLTPIFGGATEFYMANFSASNSTKISLQPIGGATLPPVICAVEAYVIIPIAGGGQGGGGGGGGGGDRGDDVSPSAREPGSAPSQVTDPTDTPPADQRIPAGSAFGGGKKAPAPSAGISVRAGWAAGMGIASGILYELPMLLEILF